VTDSVLHSSPRALASAVSGLIVIAGLVSAPPAPAALTAARVEVAAISLQSVSSAAPGPDQILEAVVTVSLAAAAMPLWYVAFPVTLPLSLALGGLLIELVDIGGLDTPVTAILGSVALGAGIFAAGPLGFALAEVLPRFTPGASAVATRAQRSTAAVTVPRPAMHPPKTARTAAVAEQSRTGSGPDRAARSGTPKKAAARTADQRAKRDSGNRASRSTVSPQTRGRSVTTIGEP